MTKQEEIHFDHTIILMGRFIELCENLGKNKFIRRVDWPVDERAYTYEEMFEQLKKNLSDFKLENINHSSVASAEIRDGSNGVMKLD